MVLAYGLGTQMPKPNAAMTDKLDFAVGQRRSL